MLRDSPGRPGLAKRRSNLALEALEGSNVASNISGSHENRWICLKIAFGALQNAKFTSKWDWKTWKRQNSSHFSLQSLVQSEFYRNRLSTGLRASRIVESATKDVERTKIVLGGFYRPKFASNWLWEPWKGWKLPHKGLGGLLKR